MFRIQFFNSRLSTFKRFSYITIFLIANVTVNGWKRERKRRKSRCKREQRIKLSNIISIKITKSYYTIVGKYSHPLSHCPNFQKCVQDAARQKRTQALNANHKDVNISGRKATFSLPSVTKLPLLSLPPRIVVTSCQVYSLPLSVRSLPTHQVQPIHLPLHKGRRHPVSSHPLPTCNSRHPPAIRSARNRDFARRITRAETNLPS